MMNGIRTNHKQIIIRIFHSVEALFCKFLYLEKPIRIYARLPVDQASNMYRNFVYNRFYGKFISK